MEPRHSVQAVIRLADASGYVAKCLGFSGSPAGDHRGGKVGQLARGCRIDAGRGEDLAVWNLAPRPSLDGSDNRAGTQLCLDTVGAPEER